MKRKLLQSILFYIVFISFSINPAENLKTFHLTIFHSNDFHGYEPINLARQSAVVKQERLKNQNVLFLNAGDVFTRGKYHYNFFGELEFAELNAMNIDAITLGNNEFKATSIAATSQQYLFDRIKNANFPVLCANVRKKDDGLLLPYVKPYIIKEINGLKIGIFGISANRISIYNQSIGLIVDDEIVTAKKIFNELSVKSDIVIALTHIGIENDILLAKAINGISVIVGGDSHTVLKEPFIENGIPIVQAGGEANQYLGRFDLTFELINKSWKLKYFKEELIPLDNLIIEDPVIKGILDSFLSKIKKSAA